MKSSVKTRKIISKWTAILFLATGLSGLLLMVTHPGHGSGASQAFIISKHIHELAAIPFLIIAASHIYYNRETLLRYFSKN